MNNGVQPGETMADERFLPAQNLRHNIITLQQSDEKTNLMTLAERYFLTAGGRPSQGTIDAKQRDHACFLHFYVQLYGHDDARQWYKSVTEAFLKDLARGKGPRPSTGGCITAMWPLTMRTCPLTSSLRYHPACWGIRCSGRSPMKRGFIMRWSSLDTGAIAVSGAM